MEFYDPFKELHAKEARIFLPDHYGCEDGSLELVVVDEVLD